MQINLEPQIQLIRQYVKRKSKISLDAYSTTFLTRRITSRMRMVDESNYEKYASLILTSDSECKKLLDSISVNVTRFYRNNAVWDTIQQKLMPMLNQNQGSRPLKIWSAGCASGEEAYTIAMLFNEYYHKPFHIFATDRNPEAIDIANKGIYKKEQFEELPDTLFQKYVAINKNNSYSIKRDSINSKLTFSVGLLDSPPSTNFDMIFCRNVMIYFSAEIKEKFYHVFNGVLKSKGFFCLGTDEFMLGTYGRKNFKHIFVDERIYRKVQ